MKKFAKGCGVIIGVLFILFVIVVIISVNSSSPPSAPAPKPPPAPAPVPAPAPTLAIYSVNQNVELGKARWILLSAVDKGSVLKSSESWAPRITEDKNTTGKFIEVILEIENIGNETETFIADPILIDSKEREYKPASRVHMWVPDEYETTIPELHPGVPKKCMLIYEVAKDATDLKLKVHDISFGGSARALISLGF